MQTADGLTGILLAHVEERIDFILVGGMAAVLHGAPITTQDIDIVPSKTQDNVERLAATLSRINARYRGQPRGRILKPTASSFKGTGHHNLMTDFGPIDVLLEIDPGWGYRDLLPQTQVFEDGKMRILVLNLPTLIKTKAATKRDKDRMTLPILLTLMKRNEENTPE